MNEFTVIISALVSVFSTIAAILAWIAKLQWSREYAAAKDETIKAKEAQINALRDQFQETIRVKDTEIEALKEFTSMKVREHYLSTKQQLEAFIEDLKLKLEAAEKDKFELAVHMRTERLKALQKASSLTEEQRQKLGELIDSIQIPPPIDEQLLKEMIRDAMITASENPK